VGVVEVGGAGADVLVEVTGVVVLVCGVVDGPVVVGVLVAGVLEAGMLD
jgi:hypothetical protein